MNIEQELLLSLGADVKAIREDIADIKQHQAVADAKHGALGILGGAFAATIAYFIPHR